MSCQHLQPTRGGCGQDPPISGLGPDAPQIQAGSDATGGLLHQRKYTVPEAAIVLGVGETKMRTLIREGDIPVVMVGGKVLLLESDMEEYLRGHHGRVRQVERAAGRLKALPQFVRDSELLGVRG